MTTAPTTSPALTADPLQLVDVDHVRFYVGNAKQAAGKAMNRPDVEAEGLLQERKGEAQQALGKGKDAVKKLIDKA